MRRLFGHASVPEVKQNLSRFPFGFAVQIERIKVFSILLFEFTFSFSAMKRSLFLIIFYSAFAFGQSNTRGESFIPAFEMKPNDLQLSRLAQPTQYFDKIGPRAGLIGCESGTFEAWVWPWKVLRNFDLQFLLGTSTQPILAKDIVRTISVTPGVTTLIYTDESFTVKEHILVPRNEPGAILLLEVHTTQPLTIIPGFIPVMQPMWPAGIGGQFSYWDDDVNAYVVSEGQWRAIFMCGSPAGHQMASPPAHMFADNPLQLKIDIKPGGTDGKFVPIVIAGALPDTTTWKMNMDSVKATYNRLWKNAGRYYRENFDYYQDLRFSTMQVITPDREFNLAYEWGKIALDNLMVTNPRLGTGLVAGFGLSGGGGRPGFAWFFGGDAFINVLAMNSMGMFRQARTALVFTQKWQRQDNFPVRKKNPSDPSKDVGKMAHELSQSDGLCDWWNDYHYGYNHADTTPWYIVAMGDYVRTSGDTAFLRQSWKSVKQAYEWCLSKDSDDDGLMDLKGAGLGALEFGKLVGIYADVYTCGVWVQAIKEMKYMSGLLDDGNQAEQADMQFRKARRRMESLFWLDSEGYYAYGATDKGVRVRDKTPWPGVAMMFGLLDEARTAKSIEQFNSADLCTDWGVRTLSNRSELFDPANYNYGAVWPFIASFFNTAQFRHHYSLSGYQILQSNIKHVFDHALGVVPEVFSGDLNEKLGEGYHHQGFSTTGYLLPLVRGLLGLDVDAFRIRDQVMFEPALPANWDTVQIKGLRLKGGTCEIGICRIDKGYHSWKHSQSGKLATLTILPRINDENLIGQSLNEAEGTAEFVAGRTPSFHINSEGYKIGSVNHSLRIIAQHFEPRMSVKDHDGEVNDRREAADTLKRKQMLTLIVEGRGGEEYLLPVWCPEEIKSVRGAELRGAFLCIKFDEHPGQEFVRKEIVIALK